MHVLDESGLRAWADTAHQALLLLRDQIDRLNVFPVADGDTGTNLAATMRAATVELAHLPSGSGWAAATSSLCRGALVGARGNSGVILAQFLQGFADPSVAHQPGLDPDLLRAALTRGQELAYRAVVHPVEGTMLTVARAAAAAATAATGGIADVAESAAHAAREALRLTTEQLEDLKRAGVVDAGGLGVLVILQSLRDVARGGVAGPSDLSEFLATPMGAHEPARPTCALNGAVPADVTSPAYEVMYVLRAPHPAVEDLRQILAELGDSVAVVGLDGLWNVHVHVDDAGAAIAAGLVAGQPTRIRVTRLHPEPSGAASPRRCVAAIANGSGVADLLRSAGAAVLDVTEQRPRASDIVALFSAAGSDEVILVPSDRRDRPAAEAAAAAARAQGMIAAVIPTSSVVQSLAAVGVHDPSTRFEDAVVSMTRAATATRYGAVTVSRHEALTSGGPCHPGDVLGLVEGDISVVGSDLLVVSRAIVDRLLTASGDLVTLVVGAGAEDGLGPALEAAIHRDHPGLDVVRVNGGQRNWPVILGVE